MGVAFTILYSHSTTNEFHLSRRMKIKVPQRVAARNSSEKSARHENSLTSKLAVSASPTKNCSDVRSRTMYDVSVVTLTRTDTTLDHSQKAEKVCRQQTEPSKSQWEKFKRCGELVQPPFGVVGPARSSDDRAVSADTRPCSWFSSCRRKPKTTVAVSCVLFMLMLHEEYTCKVNVKVGAARTRFPVQENLL